ncbi:hypothetical protein ACPA9J_33770 [Pseudomonas aeruginosa]
MSKLFIIVERKEDWTSYYPSEDVVTAQEYLERQSTAARQAAGAGDQPVPATTSTSAMATTARCSPRRVATG